MTAKTKNLNLNYRTAKITCSCGKVYEVGSTVKEMTVEICGMCHPYYSGKQKFVDTAGRLEKFKTRLAAKNKLKDISRAKTDKKILQKQNNGKKAADE